MPEPGGEKKRDPAFDEVTDDPRLPRVLLIGDSISIGYTVAVRQLLKGVANLHRAPENCGPTIRGVTELEKWLAPGKWNVIHFNFGLHDLRHMEDGRHQVGIELYEKNLRDIAARLKATGARLVWASTTPVPEGKVSPPRMPADVVLYNAAAKKIMDAEKIPTNDLYAFALPRLKEIQQPVNVHFTPEGSMALGEQVAAVLKGALK
jgi:lysophospholipase L1-like esterase